MERFYEKLKLKLQEVIDNQTKIKDIQELKDQLDSLKEEALYMMRGTNGEEIFVKDFYALKIILILLEEVIDNAKV